MKKHIILSLIFLIVLLLSSCEKVYITKLRNSTETDLILEIILDKDSVNKYSNHLKESTIISFNNGGKLIQIDSTNYIATFLLKSKEEYAFEGGLGEKPKFTEISKINIYGKDTLRINSRAEMFKNFEEESNRQYVLEVKQKQHITATTDFGKLLNGKLVLYLANPKMGLNLVPNPL